jgi:hypothetical protein
MPFAHRAALLVAIFVIAAAGPVRAQNEAALRDYFEGKSVRVRIDMPATQQGIDVYPDARRPLDFDVYSNRVKSYGIAVRNGDSIMITRVRVKEKVIEFQLGGGGYGTFGDDTGTVSATTVSKSNREKDLEQAIKNERDAERKRRMQRELDDLRRQREREDALNRNIAASATEANKSRIAEKRLQGGSRFNLRYQNGVPPGIEPDGLMRALEEYVEFSFTQEARPPRQDRPQPRETVASASSDLRKGLTLPEVEKVLGKPSKSVNRFEGTLRVTQSTYVRGGEVITAEFVEGVLVKYSIASK